MTALVTIIDYTFKAAGLIGGALGIYNYLEARKRAMPFFESAVRATNDGYHVVAIRVVNRRPWHITLRRTELASASDNETVFWGTWDSTGTAHRTALPAASLPVDLNIPVIPGSEIGFAFMFDGPLNGDIRVNVDWWDNGHKAKLRTIKLAIPQSMIHPKRFLLSDIEPSKMFSEIDEHA